MSDDSTTAIPQQVYNQLLFYLAHDERQDPLSAHDFRSFCTAAIKDTDPSVLVHDLWRSVATPYVRNSGMDPQTTQGMLVGTATVPLAYDRTTLRTVVQGLYEGW